MCELTYVGCCQPNVYLASDDLYNIFKIEAYFFYIMFSLIIYYFYKFRIKLNYVTLIKT